MNENYFIQMERAVEMAREFDRWKRVVIFIMVEWAGWGHTRIGDGWSLTYPGVS